MQILLRYVCKCNKSAISRVFRVSLYSTETLTSTASEYSLQSKISSAIDRKVSLVPALEQWRKEGRSIKQQHLHRLIRKLRTFKRYHHALEVYEWMRDKIEFQVKAGDVALHLDLISKVHGLEQMEKYFNGTLNSLRTIQVYGALLNCYSQKVSLEKAETIMQEIRDRGFVDTLSCNAMLSLYSRLGKHEKLNDLLQEMEENGISWDSFTYCLLLNAYGDTSDIEGMEKVLKKLEPDPSVNSDWNAYIAAANSYLKADLKEKAVEMLKKSEKFINGTTRRFGYEILLTLYTAVGNKAELYRIWKLYKTMGKFFNSSYVCMVSSLLKLDDMHGAEKIFEEWMPRHKSIDFRVPNLLIHAYCNKGLLEKAEQVVSRIIEKGAKPTAVTWEILAAGYHENNQMEKAVDTMKKALMATPQQGRKPNPVAFRA